MYRHTYRVPVGMGIDIGKCLVLHLCDTKYSGSEGNVCLFTALLHLCTSTRVLLSFDVTLSAVHTLRRRPSLHIQNYPNIHTYTHLYIDMYRCIQRERETEKDIDM